jgi:hypothetical protein
MGRYDKITIPFNPDKDSRKGFIWRIRVFQIPRKKASYNL